MAVIGKKLKDDRYIGALVAVGACIQIPILAAFLTLLGYFWLSSLPVPASVTTLLALLGGLILTIIVWLLLALLFRPLATAEGGKLSDYEVLQGNLNVLKAQFAAIQSKATDDKAQPATPPEPVKTQSAMPPELVKAQPATPPEPDEIAIAEIQSNFDGIDKMLKCNGLTWVLRTGYISLWDRFNKVDEAMIDVMPSVQVIEGANYDISSLTDSKVPNNKDLIKQLQTAISTLSSDPDRFKQSAEQKNAVEPSGSSTTTSSKEQEARSSIRQVRAALHRYTNERWDALVRARNKLIGTALVTSVLTYISVDVAILVRVPAVTLEQISVFYLLGAIVGLFSQMINESNAADAGIFDMDDYGLKGSRILVTPLHSGLAALVGVLLTTMLSIVLATTLSHSTTNFPTLGNIYNFNMYPQNLVFAAIFGYLPSLVIGLLKQQVNKIQSEIHSSSPAA